MPLKSYSLGYLGLGLEEEVCFVCRNALKFRKFHAAIAVAKSLLSPMSPTHVPDGGPGQRQCVRRGEGSGHDEPVGRNV